MLKQKTEEIMSKLNTLNLITYVRQNNKDPKLKRRSKLIEKLNEQILLAKDSTYSPTTRKWIIDDSGERKRVVVAKRIKQWWDKDANGNTVLTVRYGSKLLELAKGKSAIKLASDNDVVNVLGTVVVAVEAGELDAAIEQQTGTTKLKLKAKA
jgi:hypothetical protein